MGCSTPRVVLALVAAALEVTAQILSYEDGPDVGNGALSLCNTDYGTLEQAMSWCEADPSCRTLHDWNCDGENWRACSATISELQAASSDTLACSRFRTFGYEDGPDVGNGALSVCSSEYGTLEQAISECEADPSCHTLHDWNCDGENWRACSATISQLQAASSDTLGCSRVRPSTHTTTSMTTTTGTATASTAGPCVDCVHGSTGLPDGCFFNPDFSACTTADGLDFCKVAGTNYSGPVTSCETPLAVYALVTDGSDCERIMDIAECAAAAQQLGLADTTVSDDGQTGVLYDPPYCYYEGGSLKFNAGGSNTGSCSASDSCLCSLSASCGHCVHGDTGLPDGCVFDWTLSACVNAAGSEYCRPAGSNSFPVASCAPRAPTPAPPPPPTPAPPPTPCCPPARRLEGAEPELASRQPRLLVL